MKQLERRLMLYEEKYGILSQDFYDALKAGKLSRYDEFDETRTDFSRWKGIYETWQRRKTAYSGHSNKATQPTRCVCSPFIDREATIKSKALDSRRQSPGGTP